MKTQKTKNTDMSIHDIRQLYTTFFQNKGHAFVSPASLLPSEQDKSLLFTNSGMFPLFKYLRGDMPHELGDMLTNSQPCFRTNDIDDIGDSRHTTYFEMLGNWSLNRYFKREQLPMRYEFLIEQVGIDSNRLYQTVFCGNDTIPADTESTRIMNTIFRKYGINAKVASPCTGPGELGSGKDYDFTQYKIFPYAQDKNRRQRGEKVGEIGGACSETFFDTGKPHDPHYGPFCHPNCDCGRFVEIGNSVFMQYILKEQGRKKMKRRNVDFGGGLERITMAAKGSIANVFLTDAFSDNITFLQETTGKTYEGHRKSFEIICDHIKASSFLIKAGLAPSNKDQGYYLKRLIRRIALHLYFLDALDPKVVTGLINNVVASYKTNHPDLPTHQDNIISTITTEINKFQTNLKKLEKIVEQKLNGQGFDAKFVFDLQSTYGIPTEISLEYLRNKGVQVDHEEIAHYQHAHKEISRQGAEQRFKSHLGQ